jgi:hypothetical protein
MNPAPTSGLGNTGEKRALILVLAFEVFDALAELVLGLLEMVVLLLEVVVRTADEGVRVFELAVEIFPFLHMLNLDVHGEAFGHKVKLMPEAFDQHAGVPLDLFQSFVHLATQLLELPVNALKALINAFETTVMPV